MTIPSNTSWQWYIHIYIRTYIFHNYTYSIYHYIYIYQYNIYIYVYHCTINGIWITIMYYSCNSIQYLSDFITFLLVTLWLYHEFMGWMGTCSTSYWVVSPHRPIKSIGLIKVLPQPLDPQWSRAFDQISCMVWEDQQYGSVCSVCFLVRV